MKILRKPKPIWIALILSLFVHFFLIGRFHYLLEVSSDEKIIEKSYVACISLKLKTNLSPPLENSEVRNLNLESDSDFKNIENGDRGKQVLHLEEKIVKRELPVEEIVQDNRDKKEVPYSPVIRKIENQEEITEDFTQKVSTIQVTEEETPKNPVEAKEEIHQIKQESEEELLFNKTISAEKMEEKPVQGDFNIALQEDDYKNEEQVKKNPEIEETLDFSANNYSNNVNPPELLEFQRPVYPKNLRERDIEGKVILKILIDKEGKVQEIHIFESSGYKTFDQAAVKSVQQWQFKPARKGNQPRESWVLIPINFQIK